MTPLLASTGRTPSPPPPTVCPIDKSWTDPHRQDPSPPFSAAATAATLEQVLGLDTTNPAPPSTTVIYGAPYGSSGQAHTERIRVDQFPG